MSDEVNGPPVQGWLDELEHEQLSRGEFTRRLLAAGVSLGAVGSVLGRAGAAGAGVRVRSRAADTITLQFWKFDNAHDDAAIKRAVKKWNAQSKDVQVKFQTFPFSDYLGTKLTTAFASGHGPDIFWISPGQFLNYVNNGIAAPLDDVIGSARKQYLPAAISAVTVDGHIQALPFEMEPVALYYNKAILKKEGVAPPRTWAELLAACEKLTTRKRYGIVLETAQNPYQNFTWYPFLWSGGGEVVDKNWTHSTLKTRAGAAAFELWGQLVNKGYAPKKTAAITADAGPLGRGETAMQICGFWAIAQLKSAFPKLDYGVTRLPIPKGGKPVTVYGGWTQMVNSKSDHVDEAKAFTKWLWLQNRSFPKDWACLTNTKFSPRRPVNASCAREFGKPPKNYFTSQVLPTARAEPRYPDQIVKAVGDGIQAALFGGKSGADAAKLAAGEIDRFLKSYRGAK
jgi:multiple sugar transport system substrate-binding protein